jgi:multidrug efflux pump subunit AcrA (membrane-fusion protein)
VLFDLEDKDDRLRPGMFAEIGLGTDPREAILIPTSAVIHVNREDYVFRHTDDGGPYYDVVKVEVSEAPGDMVEVLSGLKPGDRIAGNDAVLFKPLAIRSLAD